MNIKEADYKISKGKIKNLPRSVEEFVVLPEI
jgi:hypothetical protein